MITVTITWNSTRDKKVPGVEHDRFAILTELIKAKKTDGTSVVINENTVTRLFTDQESADTFISRLTQSCNTNGVTPPTFSTH